MLTSDQVGTYLEKLGLDYDLVPDKSNLDALVYAHQTNIPFCTVDICRTGTPPDLSLETIFDKVVTRGRGGYCFELNKLFEALLASLGYDVRPVLSRAVRGREGRMPINHRGMIVTIGGNDYFCDVGFGGPMPAGALKLVDGLEQDVLGDIFISEKTGDSWWKIDRITKAASDLYDDERPSRRQTELEVCTADVEDIDFSSLSLFCSQPGTLFHDSEVINLRTPGGYKGYKDGILTIRENGEKQVIELASDEERVRALEDHFAIRDN